MDSQTLWQTVLSDLELQISRASFKTLLSQTHLVSFNNKRAIVGCNNPLLINLIEKKYRKVIKKTLDSYTKTDNKIVFQPIAYREKETTNGPLFKTYLPLIETKGLVTRMRLNPEYTFKNFAISPTNQMAYAATTAIAKSPGSTYNPLFLYGGVGVGKTHLIQAIAHYTVNDKPTVKIIYCTGEEFTNEIIEAIFRKTTTAFKKKYRKLDMFLIDDVQFIAGKSSTQEEFFHTFNAIQQAGGQIVLTSDRPPEEINKLEERLRSRFVGGLTIDIGPPDFELRTAILLIKAKQRGVNLPIELAKMLAASIKNTRKLEGVFIRILIESQTRKIPVNEELVKKILGKSIVETEKKNRVSPENIIKSTASYYNIKLSQLKGKRRDRKFAWPRQVIYFLLRTKLDISLEQIGVLLGGRDHTTILYGVNKVSRILEKNEDMRVDILRIKKELFG